MDRKRFHTPRGPCVPELQICKMFVGTLDVGTGKDVRFKL